MPHRAHPLTILGNLWRVMYLIVIPVLRGFLLALQDNFEAWLRGAWADILIFLLMLGIAALRWRAVRLEWDEAALRLCRGVLFPVQRSVQRSKIAAVCVTRPFYLLPFGAARLRVNTLAGGKKPTVTLLLRPNVAYEVSRWFSMQPQNEKSHAAYTPRHGSVLALSLLNSNSLGGIVFIAALVGQSGKLLGNEFSRRIVGEFEEATRNITREAARGLAVVVPPAAAAIALLLLAGWALSFFFALLRYKKLSVSQNGGTLHIRDGILVRQSLVTRCGAVSFIDIRQSLTTKILGLHSLYIQIPGDGKKRGEEMACIIAAEKQKKFARILGRIFPGLAPSPCKIRPGTRAIMRFLAAPLCFCALIATAMATGLLLLKNWSGFILFAGLMGFVPVALFLTVRILDYRTGGLSRDGDVYTMRYSKWLYFHTVVIHSDKIIQAQLRQSVFQRGSGACDVIVYARAGGRALHRCRGISLEKATGIFDIPG